MATYTIYRTGIIEGNPSFSNKLCSVKTEDAKGWVNATFLVVEAFREGVEEQHADRSTVIELIDGDQIHPLGVTYLRFNTSTVEVVSENVDETEMQQFLINEPVVIRIGQKEHHSSCSCCED